MKISKVDLLLLGILNKKPLSGYELNKFLDKYNLREFFRIGVSTVYHNLKRLEKKELIDGTVLKNSNFPDKKIFTITDKGCDYFYQALDEVLSSSEYEHEDYYISVFFIEYLPKEKMNSYINKRLKRIENMLEKAQSDYDKQNFESFDAPMKLIFENYVQQLKFDKSWHKLLLKEVDKI